MSMTGDRSTSIIAIILHIHALGYLWCRKDSWEEDMVAQWVEEKGWPRSMAGAWYEVHVP